MSRAPYGLTPMERFVLKSEAERTTGGCWLWPLNQVTDNGYALFYVDPQRQLVSAHRWAYETFVGPVPDGLVLDHLCHTRDLTCPGGGECQHRRCVNPDHLEPVTQRENVMRSSTAPGALNARKTHCPRNHPYTEANTYVTCGRRVCKTCNAAKVRRYRARRRALVGAA